MDRREYVCNQMYKQHDLLGKGSWTDADKLEYMELNIAPYSRYWRMGMKKALKHAIRLLREEEETADRKTEPSIDIEPKQGKWIDAEIRHEDGVLPIQVCSECKTFYPLEYTGGGHHFCPNCGASMREREGE